MIHSAKSKLLQLLDRFGYRVLKASDHDALLARAGQLSGPPATAVSFALGTGSADEVVRAGQQDIAGPRDFSGATEPQVDHMAPFDAPAFAPVLARMRDRPGFSVPRLHAIFSATQQIIDNGIEGDFVDCGSGDPMTLLAIAASLLHLKHPTRRLVLFDTTANPLHRAELELPAWGIEGDLLRGTAARRLPEPEPAPAELLATGYPPFLIVVRRYPREPIAHEQPVAFLNVTSETYPANLLALDVFFSRLARGGVLAVEGERLAGKGDDAIAVYLREQNVALSFTSVGRDFRIGTKP